MAVLPEPVALVHVKWPSPLSLTVAVTVAVSFGQIVASSTVSVFIVGIAFIATVVASVLSQPLSETFTVYTPDIAVVVEVIVGDANDEV